MAIIVDRFFRYNTHQNFWDDMIAAGMVVPRDENDDLFLVNGTYVAVNDPGAPGLFYRADYRLFTLQTEVDDLDPPTLEDRGLHINMRVTGARANAISAQLDNFYRQANPVTSLETPANVMSFYNLAIEGTENPGQKVVRKGAALTNGTLFDFIGVGQPSDKNSQFYARKRTFGVK